MNRNQRLNLNGIFGFNKLLVGKTDVEPKIKDNAVDITYIYNNVTPSLQSQISTSVQNMFNASEVITTFNSTLSSFQISLSNLTTKEANDVSNLQGQIDSNYTTLDNKYNQKVNSLTSKQTDLQTQLSDLDTKFSNTTIGVTNANTWTALQTLSNGLTVDGGFIALLRDTTIGSTSANTLTIKASPTFKSGLTVESGSVSFPSRSIDASCINNLPTGISLSNANTWTRPQTFNEGITTNGITNSGSLNVSGDITVGTTSTNSFTINATPTFASTPTFNRGLTVSSGSVSFPAGSIASTCITGLLSLSNANTWTGSQTLSNGLTVSGGTVNLTRNTTIGENSNQSLTVHATPTFNSGLTVASGAISVPNNSLSIASINGLSTKITSLESDITSQSTKLASDKSDLQLQINTLKTTAGVKGDTGAPGEKGDTGASGPAGPAEPAGPTGPTGARGAAETNGTNGTNGAKGERGEPGAQGPQGPAGVASGSVDNANTWIGLQTFSGGIAVTSGPVTIDRNTTIGENSTRTLTVNASPTFKSGLKVESGRISIPNNSLEISAIENLSFELGDLDTRLTIMGGAITMYRTLPKTWEARQTFDSGLSVTGGTIILPNNSISSSAISGLITSTAQNTWSALQTFASGLSVSAGTVTFPNSSISSSAISGLITSATQNTWSALQTFSGGLTVSGGTVTFPNNSISASCISGLPTSSSATLPTTTMSTLTSTQIGYQITSTTTPPSTSVIKGTHQLCTISGLTPVGSVWIIEVFQQQDTNANYQNTYYLEVRKGSTYANNSGHHHNGGNIMTLYRSFNQSVASQQIWQHTDSQTCTYVVPDDAGKSIVLGVHANSGTSASGMQFKTIMLRATRIA